MRDKLIELIGDAPYGLRTLGQAADELISVESIADYLIANGVTFADVPDTNVGKWIPVSESLPEDDERVREHKDFRLSLRSVLIHDKERGVLIANRYKIVACGTVCLDELVTDGWVWSNNAQNVTHWMPMPEPPKEGE